MSDKKKETEEVSSSVWKYCGSKALLFLVNQVADVTFSCQKSDFFFEQFTIINNNTIFLNDIFFWTLCLFDLLLYLIRNQKNVSWLISHNSPMKVYGEFGCFFRALYPWLPSWFMLFMLAISLLFFNWLMGLQHGVQFIIVCNLAYPPLPLLVVMAQLRSLESGALHWIAGIS